MGSIVPGLIIGLIIRFRTKVSEAPPALLTIYSCLCFVMAIMWIHFTSNEIMDLLQLFGFVSHLPASLLALTIVSWGNCLGDMTADVAMAKRGYGEMAITGTIAGPIFNILCGLGLGQTFSILYSKNPMETVVGFSLYQDVTSGSQNGVPCTESKPCSEFNKVSLLPLCLLVGQCLVLTNILVFTIKNKYHVTFASSVIGLTIYACIILGLVIFSLIDDVKAPDN